jgi:2-dehydro-3-deoxyphosphooctonate aldolase (KDO 8-P synthase)
MLVFAGPCVIESEVQALHVARHLAAVAGRAGVEIVYKSSFDKANRSSAASPRGPGMERGLEILAEVKTLTGLRVLTDIHETAQAGPVSEVADILQIPAILCRQTDLLQAAVQTGRPVLVKKGQFMSPHDMKNIVVKAEAALGGAALPYESLMLCERGTSFGYNELVVDMRSLEIMRQFGHPIVFDATHAVQRPGAQGQSSGGDRALIPALARAAAAVGIDGLFLETHPDPARALSDPATAWPLAEFEALIEDVLAIHRLVRRSGDANPGALAAAE